MVTKNIMNEPKNEHHSFCILKNEDGSSLIFDNAMENFG